MQLELNFDVSRPAYTGVTFIQAGIEKNVSPQNVVNKSVKFHKRCAKQRMYSAKMNGYK